MVRPLRVLALPIALCLLAVGCSGDDDGSSPTSVGDGVTETTVSPLAGPVQDTCGNDIDDLSSTVWGVDAETGSVRWSTPVALAEPYVLPDPSGDVRLSLTRRPVEALLDVESGDVVDLPEAGVHEVLVDTANSAVVGGSATLLVDGERQPPTIEVGDASISTGRGSTGQEQVTISAVDPDNGAPLWDVVVGSADVVGAISPPVLYGETVVVVTSPPLPPCS